MKVALDAARIASFLAEARARAALASRTGRQQVYGAWLRNALVAQGPTFIKAGQFLSSRNDVLPRSVAKELRSLQDDVDPMDFATVQTLVNAETGMPSIWDVFETFDEAPVASASIGQVHRARLKEGGADVAVKIQKPGITESFQSDLVALRALVNTGEMFGMRGGSDATHVLDDLQTQLECETDFLQEAANMQRFRKASQHIHWLRVPYAVEPLCTKRLLVMEYVDYDFKTSKVPDDYQKRYITAHRLVELLMWMVMDTGFLHCDMHPGNLCVKDDGTVVMYDFGTVLDITNEYRDVMQELAIHMYNNDPKKTVKVMLKAGMMTMKSGYKPEDAELFFSTVIKSTRPDFNASEMSEKMGEPPFIASASIFRLFRTMMLVEGACKSFDPDFSYFRYMRPFLGAQMAMFSMFEP
jgi:predicted unusual protein kinase regulating ubiquinone biosynthesis (AarF/ABC1/UbiB family)